MAVWNVVKNYWKKFGELSSKYPSVKRAFVGLVAFICIYGIWKIFSGPSATEVNSTIASSNNAELKKKIMVFLNEIFSQSEVPPFFEENGGYFCDADTSTEAYQMAYKSVGKFLLFKSSLYRRITLSFKSSPDSYSPQVVSLIQKISIKIKDLDQYPGEVKNSIMFETAFERHLKFLDYANTLIDESFSMTLEMNKISHDNLVVSSSTLTQLCERAKLKLAEYSDIFKEVIEVLNSVPSFEEEIKKKNRIECSEFTNDKESGSLNTDKTILIEKLSKEIEQKKMTIKSQFQKIRRIIDQSIKESQKDFMKRYSVDDSYLSVPYLKRSVMYNDVFKLAKKICDEFVIRHQ